MIRPLSRFQILLSKYITVLLFGFLLLFILFMGSTLLGLIFFGTGGDTLANVHLIYKDGHVFEQNMMGYLAKTYLSESVAALMIATMAFMLSAVFRNSSLAVGFSIFCWLPVLQPLHLLQRNLTGRSIFYLPMLICRNM